MTEKLVWEPWDRTNEHVDEWTTWDVQDEWFLHIERRGLIWHWYVACVPKEVDEIECKSWALTKGRAMAQAKAKAQTLQNIHSGKWIGAY